MGRALRIEYDGACYHIINYGLEKIFLKDSDRTAFFDILEETSKRYKIEIHAYLLMEDHYNLIVKTPLANLSKALRHINSLYTVRFNETHGRNGPLFKGRYKSVLLEEENYLLKMSFYLHSKASYANLVANDQDYKWSSYRAYIGKEKPESWLHLDEVLAYTGNSTRKYRKLFEKTVLLDDHLYEKGHKMAILGSDKFIKKITEQYLNINHNIINTKPALQNLREIQSAVAKKLKVDEDLILLKNSKEKNPARDMAIYLACFDPAYQLKDLGVFFGGVKSTAISNSYARCIADMKANKKSAKLVDKLRKELKIS